MRALIRFCWFSVFTLLEWNLKIPLYAVYFLVATQFVFNWLFIGIALVIPWHVDPRKGDATEQKNKLEFTSRYIPLLLRE